MAAGLTLVEERLPAFVAAFAAEASRLLSEEDRQGDIYTDGPLADEEFSLPTAKLLRDAGPWGQGFPAPQFDGNFEILEQRVVGERHLKMLLRPIDGSRRIEGIAFGTGSLPATCRVARLVYRLDVNEYRGVESAQLAVEHIEHG